MLRNGYPKNYELPTLNLRDQLRAGRHGRRWVQLVVGLLIAALSIAMMVEAHLGLDPWNVLHEGLVKHLGLSFGTVTIISGVAVLLLWLVPTPDELWLRVMFLLVGVVLCGAAGAVYLGSHLGPGPRDGLMTGLVARTGRSIRLVRTGLEAAVLLVGFLLGGTVGIGTVLFAVTIGPLIQFF